MKHKLRNAVFTAIAVSASFIAVADTTWCTQTSKGEICVTCNDAGTKCEVTKSLKQY